jgi:YidC/Oxa1 family membrane protein insertase
MDRRTLIAFVLLTLVLILYQYMSPKRQSRPPVATVSTLALRGADTSQTNSGPAPSSIAPAPSATGGPSVPAADRSQFANTLVSPDFIAPPLVIERGVYRAVLDPRGGRFTSWVLAKYTDARESTADLVADPQAGLFQLHLHTPGGDQDLSRTPFQMSTADPEGDPVVTLLAADASGATVQIRYQFPRDRYSTRMRISLSGFPEGGRGSSLELAFPAGIASLERDPKLDQMGAAGAALLGRRVIKHRLGRGHGNWSEKESGVVEWAGTRSKYFLLAAIPKGSPDGDVILSHQEGSKSIASAVVLALPLEGPAEFEFEIYAGPMHYRELESYGVGLEKAVDLGWRIIVPFSRLLLLFFLAVHRIVANYGVVILILSVLTKVLFYPLTKKSMESMKQMQLLKPEIDRLNDKHKGDAQRRNQAMMELYKKHKINPLGGCLPVLIQMPVFIALYNVLNTSIELRKAPFFLWIQDLSAPDRVGQVLGFPLHILPLLMAGTMIWQQKLTPSDPRQAAMAYMMPIIMTVFFYPMPSGLVFYWTVNNLMSVGQQIWMNRTMKRQLVLAP